MPRYDKRLFIILLAVCLMSARPAPAMAQDNPADAVSSFEQYVFAQTFNGQPLADRLSRLENVIFGTPQTGDPIAREEHLSQVLTPLIRQQQAQKPAASPNDTSPDSAATAPSQATQPQSALTTAQEPDATSYPTVSALERKIIGRDFVGEDITLRLNRLEQRVFGQPTPQLALSDRVDRLLSENPDIQTSVNPTPVDPDNGPRSALDGLPPSGDTFAGHGDDTYLKLTLLEKNLLGQTHTGELITERLDRLEQKAYGYDYSGESVDTRLNRLLANYQNRYSQTSPLQQPPQQPAATQNNPPQSTRPQNIQIGAGMASNSTYSMSPELLQMLPPDMRQQLAQQSGQSTYQGGYTGSSLGGASSYGGTTVTGPGTVIMQQQTTGPFGTTTRTTSYGGNVNGFNTYGGPPVQYRSYSSVQTAPGTTITQQVGVPTPLYYGNPNVFQTLQDLELRVNGTSNPGLPFQTRLTNLETQLTGKSFPNYSDADRVNNLVRIFQYQTLSKTLNNNASQLGIPLTPPPAAQSH